MIYEKHRAVSFVLTSTQLKKNMPYLQAKTDSVVSIHSQFYEEYDNLTLPLLQFYKAMVGLRLTFSIDPRHVMTQCV